MELFINRNIGFLEEKLHVAYNQRNLVKNKFLTLKIRIYDALLEYVYLERVLR